MGALLCPMVVRLTVGGPVLRLAVVDLESELTDLLWNGYAAAVAAEQKDEKSADGKSGSDSKSAAAAPAALYPVEYRRVRTLRPFSPVTVWSCVFAKV
jgi:hypothetical protein